MAFCSVWLSLAFQLIFTGKANVAVFKPLSLMSFTTTPQHILSISKSISSVIPRAHFKFIHLLSQIIFPIVPTLMEKNHFIWKEDSISVPDLSLQQNDTTLLFNTAIYLQVETTHNWSWIRVCQRLVIRETVSCPSKFLSFLFTRGYLGQWLSIQFFPS